MKKLNLGLCVEVPVEETKHNRLNDSFNINDHSIHIKGNHFTSDGFVTTEGEHHKISDKDIRIIKTLGRGASSTVHKGFLAKENKFVAIKKINVFEKDTRHQMMNDVKALCQGPAGPGLIEFHGAFCVPDSGQISIALEYMDGGSLADLVQKVQKIPENILSKITAKVLQGLMHLHKRHLVHRDIKPANILMNTEGEPKITDFGISAFIDSTLAVCHTFLGTVTYMSPERINNQPYSFPADIWSLGLALIECATGQYPYDASVGPLQLMIQVVGEDCPVPRGPQFSDEFRDFVKQCMEKDPYRRPPAEQLLSHPFITKYESDPASLKEFMQCCFDPHEKLDEIAMVFAWNFYALVSAGPNRLNDLAPLYSESSVLSHEGEVAKGRQPILAKMKEVVGMYAGFGKATYTVDQVDCQPLGLDGSALVHVQGRITMNAMGKQPALFAETFILSQARPREYYVANQSFRLLKE